MAGKHLVKNLERARQRLLSKQNEILHLEQTGEEEYTFNDPYEMQKPGTAGKGPSPVDAVKIPVYSEQSLKSIPLKEKSYGSSISAAAKREGRSQAAQEEVANGNAADKESTESVLPEYRINARKRMAHEII